MLGLTDYKNVIFVGPDNMSDFETLSTDAESNVYICSTYPSFNDLGCHTFMTQELISLKVLFWGGCHKKPGF